MMSIGLRINKTKNPFKSSMKREFTFKLPKIPELIEVPNEEEGISQYKALTVPKLITDNQLEISGIRGSE